MKPYNDAVRRAKWWRFARWYVPVAMMLVTGGIVRLFLATPADVNFGGTLFLFVVTCFWAYEYGYNMPAHYQPIRTNWYRFRVWVGMRVLPFRYVDLLMPQPERIVITPRNMTKLNCQQRINLQMLRYYPDQVASIKEKVFRDIAREFGQGLLDQGHLRIESHEDRASDTLVIRADVYVLNPTSLP